MRTFLFISLFVAVQVPQVYSQQVSMDEAERAAQNFFGKTRKSVQTCADMSVKGADTLFYVFNADDGFVVISGDKKAVPILAYSTESAYDADNVIPPVKMWLDSYQRQLTAIREDVSCMQSAFVGKAWEELQQPVKIRKTPTSEPVPLIKSKWGQGKFYNYYCPLDEKGNNGRVVTGCVATAMAQLMYYFRFPEKGTGSYSYTWEPYGELSADYGNAVYDYSSMVDKPTDINPSIAELMFHCGVAVDMEYGPDGSGMTNHSAADVLVEYFKFSPQTRYVFRYYTHLDWDSLIVSHIDNKIPLYYAGWGEDNAGHAFICDAYQTDSNGNYYYHFNFGWEGNQDGYFYTDELSPGGMNFNIAQELIINAYPDTMKPAPLTGTTLLTSETGSFTHGTIYDCPPYMDYTWIIRPDADDIEKIIFDIQYNLAENDTVFISYANGTHIYTDNISSFSANVIDKEIIVRLKTTNIVDSSGGLSANYSIVRKTYCTGLKQLTTNQGTVDDGSGDSRYNNFTNCRWSIIVSEGDAITVHFSKFETEEGKDILYIRDLKGSRPLLAELSGNLTDSVYTFHTNQLALNFETDEKNIFQGWTFSYNAITVGVPDFKEDKNVNIYPNPATDNLFIEIDAPLANGKIQLFDIYGRLLQEQPFNETQLQLNVNGIASGVYIAKILDGNRTVQTAKVVF